MSTKIICNTIWKHLFETINEVTFTSTMKKDLQNEEIFVRIWWAKKVDEMLCDVNEKLD